jgi:TRAP-type C4-dicarboxylate transport system substrate-binding protein
VDGWPGALRNAVYRATREAIAYQRELSEQEAVDAEQVIEGAGCEVVTLSPDELQAFRTAVKPIHDDARREFAPELWRSTDLQSNFE